jgi:hypothetical protein
MKMTVKPTIKQNVCFKCPFLDTISQCPKLHSFMIYLSHGEPKRHRRWPQPAVELGELRRATESCPMMGRSGEDKSQLEEHKTGAALLQSKQEGAAAGHFVR